MKYLAIVLLIIGCKPAPKPVEDIRTVISTTPAAEYNFVLNNKDNPTWAYNVKLMETDKTFLYKINVKYQETDVTDYVWFPNAGTAPKPVLKKGATDYECIVGFNDDKDAFRECKLVLASDKEIRFKILKQYSVSDGKK